MKIRILPDDRRLLIEAIRNLQSQLENSGPDEYRRLQNELVRLQSLKAETATEQFISPDSGKVQIGTVATLLKGGRRFNYSIGGVMTFIEGRLTCCAPLARMLVGKSVGDEVKIGDKSYQIVGIKPIACT